MVEQIYKNLFKDEEDKYLFANENDTKYVVDQQSYILIYILEMLINIDNKEENRIAFLSNEKEGKNNEQN